MRIVKILFFLVLFSNCFILFSQTNPAKVELISGSYKLDAKFYSTSKKDHSPAIILLHGFPGNQTSPLDLAEKLNAAGFNILVFNFQGSYLSEGDFSFDNCINNVEAAIHFLKNSENQGKYNIDTSRIIVCGYSFGGAIALESAIHNNEIKNIISIANDDHSVSIKKSTTDLEFRNGYQQFIAKSFGPDGPFRGDLKAALDYNIANVDRYDLVKNADKLKDRRILFIVGWQDNTCPLEVTTLPLYRKLAQLKVGNVAIKGFESDHRFNNVRDDLANTITDWINKQNAL
jgi:hypothetical protein